MESMANYHLIGTQQFTERHRAERRPDTTIAIWRTTHAGFRSVTETRVELGKRMLRHGKVSLAESLIEVAERLDITVVLSDPTNPGEPSLHQTRNRVTIATR